MLSVARMVVSASARALAVLGNFIYVFPLCFWLLANRQRLFSSNRQERRTDGRKILSQPRIAA